MQTKERQNKARKVSDHMLACLTDCLGLGLWLLLSGVLTTSVGWGVGLVGDYGSISEMEPASASWF